MPVHSFPWTSLLVLLGALALVGCPAGDDDDDDDSAATDDDDDDTADYPDYSDSACWGEAETTQLFDHDSMSFIPVDTTCRAEGERTLLYVADSIWEDPVDQELVNSFMWRYELYAPDGAFDPGVGILYNDEAVFGEMDLSEFPDEKLHVFILDTGARGDAYVCPTTYGWCDYYCLHLDGLMMDPIDGDYAMSVAAHETYHMIEHFHDASEEVWMQEAMAEAAMAVNGFYTDGAWVQSFLSNPDQNWGPGNTEHGGVDYGAALLWGTYLWEFGGPELMREITAATADGFHGVDDALEETGASSTAWELFLEMLIAIYLDAPELGYGYTSFAVPEVSTITSLGSGDDRSGHLSPYGFDYYELEGTGTLEIDVSAGAEPVFALAVAAGDDSVDVVDIADGGSLDVDSGDIAFLVFTAEDTAEYDVAVN